MCSLNAALIARHHVIILSQQRCRMRDFDSAIAVKRSQCAVARFSSLPSGGRAVLHRGGIPHDARTKALNESLITLQWLPLAADILLVI
jgi:hypothetical protein